MKNVFHSFIVERVILFISLFTIVIFSTTQIINAGEDVLGIKVGFYSNLALAVIQFNSILVILLSYKKIKLTGLTALVFLWFIITTFSCINSQRILYDFRELTTWTSIYLLFYILVKTNPSFLKQILFVIVLLILLFSPIIYIISSIRTSLLNGNATLAAINYIYYLVILLPLLILLPNKLIKNLLILLIGAITIISVKRTAIAIFLVSVLTYVYFTYFKNSQLLWYKKIVISVLILGSTIAIFNYLNNSVDGFIVKRFANIEEDRGSGRFDVYENVIKLQTKLPFENWILGKGHNAVIKENNILAHPVSAHNDFLEVLYDYGIFALIIYILIHFFLLKRVYLFYKNKDVFFISYLVSYIIFFFMSMFSHLILYNSYFIYLAIYWGSIEGILQQKHVANSNVFKTK